MSKCDDLLEKARNNPRGLRFQELCDLAVCLGWVFARQDGTSHRIYKKPGERRLMDFQEGPNGTAKPYQVRQLLNTIQD